jgi:hypothetical protein
MNDELSRLTAALRRLTGRGVLSEEVREGLQEFGASCSRPMSASENFERVQDKAVGQQVVKSVPDQQLVTSCTTTGGHAGRKATPLAHAQCRPP